MPPDTSALTDVIRNQGGPILLELTGWATPRVIEELVAAGLEPLPGYDQVERLDSMGLNLVGGIVTPESLDSVLAAPYIVSARSAHASGQRR